MHTGKQVETKGWSLRSNKGMGGRSASADRRRSLNPLEFQKRHSFCNYRKNPLALNRAAMDIVPDVTAAWVYARIVAGGQLRAGSARRRPGTMDRQVKSRRATVLAVCLRRGRRPRVMCCRLWRQTRPRDRFRPTLAGAMFLPDMRSNAFRAERRTDRAPPRRVVENVASCGSER